VKWSFRSIDTPTPIYSADDVPLLCSALKQRTADDKLIALSTLVTIYSRAGKPSDILDSVRACIAGDRALERALENHLSPPPTSPELAAAEKEHKRFETESRLQKEKNEKAREEWIARLKADPKMIGDLSIAAEGKIWNNTHWLFNEIRQKKKQNSRWATSSWHVLKEDFGDDVAEAFRDFCIKFWRLYEPKLRSEAPGAANQTPLAVILGLSGLAMEFHENPAMSSSLTDDEVRRAVKYALEEMNEMPSWLWQLYQSRPEPVEEVLVSEITWEFNTSHNPGTAGYILSRLRWNATDLGVALRAKLVDLIQKSGDHNPHAILEALIVVLRDPSPVPSTLIEHGRQHADAASTEELKALWIGFLICVDADIGVDKLERWIRDASTLEVKEERATRVLNNVWGGRFDGFNTPHKDYNRTSLLMRLLKLAHTHVRLQDDLVHEGGYSPGARDHAQEARGHLFELLYKIPGRGTYDALVELSAFHTLQYPKDRMLSLAEERAGLDIEQQDWLASDIDTFAAIAERPPRSQKQLFELTLSRLDDLKLELEEGDESEASLLRKADDEYELRRAIANRLRNAARQFYDVASEEELADKTRTDIRLHNPAVTERIPIELKIGGKWKSEELRERLENQLTKQYMQEAKYGAFVVVNRGAEKDTKSWLVDGKRVDFSKLVEWLKLEAQKLVSERSEVEGIEVIGIDLTKRDKEAQQAAKSRAEKKAAKSQPTVGKKKATLRK